MADIRCPSRKFGEVTTKSSGIYEAICKSTLCKTQPGEVVLHRWNLAEYEDEKLKTIKLIETRRFKDPTKGNRNDRSGC